MATLTIRDLDESLKQGLRIRAAHRNRSMEEEARQILKAALTEAPAPAADLSVRIRARFAGLGDIRLPLADREPTRSPPAFEEPAPATRRTPAGKQGRAGRK